MSRSKSKQFRSLLDDKVCEALSSYLWSLSVIDDDEHVTEYFKTPEGVDVKIGKV
jgi:hypothetical protein